MSSAIDTTFKFNHTPIAQTTSYNFRFEFVFGETSKFSVGFDFAGMQLTEQGFEGELIIRQKILEGVLEGMAQLASIGKVPLDARQSLVITCSGEILRHHDFARLPHVPAGLQSTAIDLAAALKDQLGIALEELRQVYAGQLSKRFFVKCARCGEYHFSGDPKNLTPGAAKSILQLITG